MGKQKIICSGCIFRKAYDKNPSSLIGRIWHWHTNFCPGWKYYVKSLSEEERIKIAEQYGIKVKK